MTVIKMNLDDIGGNFEPIPEGEYEAYVFDVEATTFRSGNEGFSVTYNIAKGPHKGRKIYDNIVLTEKAYWKLGQFWRAVTGDTGEVEIDTNDVPSMVGRRVELDIGVEEQAYQGKTRQRNVVKNMYFLGGMAETGNDLASALEGRGEINTERDVEPPF